MKTVFLKPCSGQLVRDPLTYNPLSENGEIKPYTGVEGRYWRRRIKDGSVLIITEKKKKK